MNANDQIIHPSTFNRRITVKRAVAVPDNAGGNSATFTDRFATWASVDSMSSYRKQLFGIDLYESAYEVKLRFTEDRQFTTADLVDYEDKTLLVMSVQLVKQSYKTFNILICREVAPQG